VTVRFWRVAAVVVLAVCCFRCPQVTAGPDIGCSRHEGKTLGRTFPDLPAGASVAILRLDERDDPPSLQPSVRFYASYRPGGLDPLTNVSQLGIGECRVPDLDGSVESGGDPFPESGGPVVIEGLAGGPVTLTPAADGSYTPSREVRPDELGDPASIPSVTFRLVAPRDDPTNPTTIDGGFFPERLGMRLGIPDGGALDDGGVARDGALQVRWEGREAQFTLLILGNSRVTVFCRALDKDGVFTVPSAQLTQLAGGGRVTLRLLRMAARDFFIQDFVIGVALTSTQRSASFDVR
jgi:hypothetical protein